MEGIKNKALISRLNQSSYSNAQLRWLIRAIDCLAGCCMIDGVWILTLPLVTMAEICSQAPGLWRERPILMMKAVHSLLAAYSRPHYSPPLRQKHSRDTAASPWEEIILLDTITGSGVWHLTTGSVGPNFWLIVRQLRLQGWLRHRIKSDMPVGSLCRLAGAIIILNVKLWAFTYGSLNEEICPLFSMILEAGPEALWLISEGRTWKMHNFLIFFSWNES